MLHAIAIDAARATAAAADCKIRTVEESGQYSCGMAMNNYALIWTARHFPRDGAVTLCSRRHATRHADARAVSFCGYGRPVAAVTALLLGRNTRETKGGSRVVANRGRNFAYLDA